MLHFRSDHNLSRNSLRVVYHTEISYALQHEITGWRYCAMTELVITLLLIFISNSRHKGP